MIKLSILPPLCICLLLISCYGFTNPQEMVVIKKTKKGVTERKTMQVRFVPMTGKPSQ